MHKLTGCVDFPAPWAVVNQGRTKLWRLEDVEMYEKLHLEVLSQGHKRQKMVGYYLAVTGRQESGSESEAEAWASLLLYLRGQQLLGLLKEFLKYGR